MKLSVIVPVYNVEKYLRRCLDSLLRQGLEPDEWEVICVNDGSPDNCAAILAEYEAKYPNIFKVITQENQGLSGARNTGMRWAQGEWIGFVDSDDFVIDYGYKYLLDHFCDANVDVLQFGFTLIYTDGQLVSVLEDKPGGVKTFNGDGMETYNRMALPYVWSKFYRRAFLKKYCILFESRFMEDELFNYEVFRHSPHLSIVTSNIYQYEQGNPHSLLTTTDKEKIKIQLECLLYGLKKMNDYLQVGNGEMSFATKRNINSFLKTYYNKMLKARFSNLEWKKYSMLLKELTIYKIDITGEQSILGKITVYLKNISLTSYATYLFVEMLFRTLFTNCLRPLVIASK